MQANGYQTLNHVQKPTHCHVRNKMSFNAPKSDKA